MKKPKKKNILLIYIIIAAIILAVALLAPIKNIYRILLCLPALIVLGIRKYKIDPKEKHEIPIYILLYLIAFILLDSICVVTFHKTPIFSINIINNNNIRVYNALGYKVWQCDKKKENDLVIEPFYSKGYLCDTDEIENVSINSLITSLNNNYEEYRNKYVKVTGKISKKDGPKYLEMQSYTESEDNVNGYVTFSETITLAILFEENEDMLDIYDIYDEITIVGKIKNMETNNDKRTIYMYESKIVSNIELDEYEVSAKAIPKRKLKNKEKSLIHENKENKIYTYGLNDIRITFKDKLEYELSSALSSNKITIEELIKDAKEKEMDTKDITNKTIMYKLDNYNIVVCDPEESKDIIITSPKLDINDVTCEIVE